VVLTKLSIKTALALPLRAAWAPVLVFGLHVFISRVLNAYLLFPPLDIPMHFFGGVAIAYFFAACFRALPPDSIALSLRPWLLAVSVFALTATATVFWEFAEFFSDRFFGTHAQLSLEDTLLDMALGIAGGLTYLVMTSRSRLVGDNSQKLPDPSESP
jgi:hypothetical protein